MANGWASWAEADAMPLEDLAAACEHMDILSDAQEHTRRHVLPRDK